MLMQQAANKIGATLLALALIGFWLYGCGDGDVLDENNQRYLTYVSFSDGGSDATLDVDVDYIPDCDGNVSTIDPEPFTSLFADIEIVVAEDSPGITMDNYKVSFEPLTSVDTVGNTFTPPPYSTVYHGSFDIDIPTNSTAEFTITCMEADGKAYLGTQMPALAGEMRYEITIKMSYTDEYDMPRDLTIRRTLYFTTVYRCE
jgi:hypothetical protein